MNAANSAPMKCSSNAHKSSQVCTIQNNVFVICLLLGITSHQGGSTLYSH